MTAHSDFDRRNKSANRLQETLLPGRQTAPPSGSPTTPMSGTGQEIPTLPLRLGEFVLQELLARGGMSLTLLGCKANDPAQKVVVKIPLADDPETAARFQDEIRLLHELNHPAIVRVLGSGRASFPFGETTSSRPWLAMECIDGQTLRQRLAGGQRLPWPEVRKLLGDVVEALRYLHGRQICHRDVKPDNLIFNAQKNRWILVDFGIAKSLLSNPRLTLTLAGRDPGSWDYMSPEQLDGGALDGRSDLYSLGKTAWEALIGSVPRVGTPFPCEMLGDQVVPTEVDALLARLVAHNPKDRYPSATKVREALEVGALRIESRKKRKKTARRLLRAAALLVAATLVAAGAWHTGDYLTTQEAVAAYVQTKESPTRALNRMELFAGSHSHWGRAYVDARIAELKPLAEEERRQMIAEHDAVIEEIADLKRDDEYRLNRARGFLKKYEGIFDDSPQFRAIQQRIEDLQQVVRIKKEKIEAEAAIQRARALDAAGRVKEAIAACDEAIQGFQSTAAKEIVRQFRTEVVDRVLKKELRELDDLASSLDRAELVRGEARIEELQKVVGAIEELNKRLHALDQRLWELCERRADDLRKSGRFREAEKQLAYYRDNSRVKYHTPEASDLAKRIRDSEDDAEWTRMKTSAEKNIAQKAFVLAVKDMQAYLAKWTDGGHRKEADALRHRAIRAHCDYLRETKDIDLLNRELPEFAAAYPDDSDQIVRLRRQLCFLVHGKVWDIIRDNTLTQPVKRDRLRALDYRQCETEKVAYLNDLLEHARKYLDPNDKGATWLYFQWFWERPPSDCIPFKDGPTVYFVSLKSVRVNLSDAHYRHLKGSNNADPRVDVEYGTGEGATYKKDTLVNQVRGPVNMRSFTLWGGFDFYLDTKQMDSVCFWVADDDEFAPIARAGVTFPASRFRADGKDTLKMNNDTTIDIEWKSQ